MRTKKGRKGKESGQVLVVAVFAMAVLLGMTALAVDVGFFFHERRNLQNAADAAALAGAQELPANPGLAVQKARDWAANNGIDPNEIQEVTVESTYTANDTISVTVSRDVSFFFARVLGIDQGEVSAHAKAQVGSLTGTTGLAPFGVLEDVVQYCTYQQITQTPPPQSCLTTLKYDVNDVGANIGDLDFDGQGGGADEISKKIKGGNQDPLCSINEPPQPNCPTTEPSKPGNSTGQIREGINWRLNQTTSQCDTIAEVVSPDTDGDGRPEIRPGCNPWRADLTDTDGDGGVCDNITWTDGMRGGCRIIAIPVIQPPLPQASADATNVWFALFWLNPLQNGRCSGNDCEIEGYFIDAEVSVSGLLGRFDPSLTPFVVAKLVE